MIASSSVEAKIVLGQSSPSLQPQLATPLHHSPMFFLNFFDSLWGQRQALVSSPQQRLALICACSTKVWMLLNLQIGQGGVTERRQAGPYESSLGHLKRHLKQKPSPATGEAPKRMTDEQNAIRRHKKFPRLIIVSLYTDSQWICLVLVSSTKRRGLVHLV